MTLEPPVLNPLQPPQMTDCVSTVVLDHQPMSMGACQGEKRRQILGCGSLQGRGKGTYRRDARIEGLAQGSVGPSCQDDGHCAWQQGAEQPIRADGLAEPNLATSPTSATQIASGTCNCRCLTAYILSMPCAHATPVMRRHVFPKQHRCLHRLFLER